MAGTDVGAGVDGRLVAGALVVPDVVCVAGVTVLSGAPAVSVGAGDADALGAALATFNATVEALECAGCGFRLGAALGLGEWKGVSVGSGESVGRGVRFVAGIGVGEGAPSSSGEDVATATLSPDEPCWPITDKPAPITNPRTTTPMKMGMKGSELLLGGFGRERRGGVEDIELCGSRQEDGMLAAKRARVIRIPIPIDVGMVSETDSCAFALATPIRVDQLLALAVREAIGHRAPGDKRQRSIATTLKGFAEGKFVVDIDGRIFDRLDAVVVCSGTAVLRFFSSEPQWRSLPTR